MSLSDASDATLRVVLSFAEQSLPLALVSAAPSLRLASERRRGGSTDGYAVCTRAQVVLYSVAEAAPNAQRDALFFAPDSTVFGRRGTGKNDDDDETASSSSAADSCSDTDLDAYGGGGEGGVWWDSSTNRAFRRLTHLTNTVCFRNLSRRLGVRGDKFEQDVALWGGGTDNNNSEEEKTPGLPEGDAVISIYRDPAKHLAPLLWWLATSRACRVANNSSTPAIAPRARLAVDADRVEVLQALLLNPESSDTPHADATAARSLIAESLAEVCVQRPSLYTGYLELSCLETVLAPAAGNLRRLVLHGCRLPCSFGTTLSPLRVLSFLSVAGCCCDCDCGEEKKEEDVAEEESVHHHHQPQHPPFVSSALRSLFLRGNSAEVDQVVLLSPARHPRLRRLGWEPCRNRNRTQEEREAEAETPMVHPDTLSGLRGMSLCDAPAACRIVAALASANTRQLRGLYVSGDAAVHVALGGGGSESAATVAWPALRSLRVSHAPLTSLTRLFSGGPATAVSLPALRRLTVEFCSRLSDVTAVSAASTPELRTVRFAHCQELHSLGPGMWGLPHLADLTVDHCPVGSVEVDNDDSSDASPFRALKSVLLGGAGPLAAGSVDTLLQAPLMQHASFSIGAAADLRALLPRAAAGPRCLTTLSIAHSRGVTSLAPLWDALPLLRRLDASGTDITGLEGGGGAPMTALEELTLNFCESLRALRGAGRLLPALRVLSLDVSAVVDLRGLRGCRRLEEVSCSLCDDLRCLAPLGGLPHLQTLKAAESGVECVAGLGSCPRLRELSLRLVEGPSADLRHNPAHCYAGGDGGTTEDDDTDGSDGSGACVGNDPSDTRTSVERELARMAELQSLEVEGPAPRLTTADVFANACGLRNLNLYQCGSLLDISVFFRRGSNSGSSRSHSRRPRFPHLVSLALWECEAALPWGPETELSANCPRLEKFYLPSQFEEDAAAQAVVAALEARGVDAQIV